MDKISIDTDIGIGNLAIVNEGGLKITIHDANWLVCFWLFKLSCLIKEHQYMDIQLSADFD
ncbi:hypothetical protein [Budvicia aquatica]|uniref:Uncharacterized protein n=1 Tax=Budvicia aquatica TaxID=82979 RepID=A0A2C6DES8_9GAMM|nr:hypothetical protein [Budvicia aquatica]PHI28788.1 hypothetical protein CRN84_05385 [Budvicia aquatica]VFS46847.1 Uncharacterised protein [Budvicia aquatica]